MSQVGKISKSGIDKILRWAKKGEKTGAFAFSRNEEKKYVYIKNGEIVTASSNNPKERLGQIMLRLGMITNEQIERIQELQKKEKSKFGKTVLQLKYVTQKDLITALHKQTEEIVINLFDWLDGDFLFYLNKLPPVELSSFPLTLDELIAKGLERKKAWDDISGEFPSLDDIVEVSFDVPENELDQQYDEKEFKVITLIDGLASIREICMNSEMNDYETACILAKLIKNKNIQIKKELHDEDTRSEIKVSSTGNGDKGDQLKREISVLLSGGEYVKARELIQQELDQAVNKKGNDIIARFQNEITSLSNVPHLINGSDEENIKNSIKDAQTGFILSRIDGKLNIKLLSNISGLPKENVQNIIFNLFNKGIIHVEKAVIPEGESLSPELDEKPIEEVPEDISHKIMKKYQSMSNLDYYDILEIEKNAEESDIKKSYHVLAKKYHPDMVREIEDENVKKCAEILFEKIQLAYDTLHDIETKNNYDRAKGFNLTEEEQRRLARLRTKAGLQYQIGMKAYKARNYKKAIEFIKSAIDINPEESMYYGILAEIQSKNPKWLSQAKTNIEKAIDLDAHNPLFYITFGLINIEESLPDDAENNFQKALALDPGNEEAINQLEKLGKKVKKKEIDPYDKIITKDIALR